MRRHSVVGYFHYRVAQSRTDHDFLRDGLTSQTNHGQFDWFDRCPVQLKAQVMFPHLPTKIAVAGSNSELASRSLFPCAPGDGAVRAFKCFPGGLVSAHGWRRRRGGKRRYNKVKRSEIVYLGE